jgi:lactoylglutathione lyase
MGYGASAFSFSGPGSGFVYGLPMEKQRAMELGAFLVSLAVKDIGASRAFYEKLGFKVVAGDASQHWLVLNNRPHAIGLFQGMFEKNILTFNPGWDSNANKLDRFKDVRDLQPRIESARRAAKVGGR